MNHERETYPKGLLTDFVNNHMSDFLHQEEIIRITETMSRFCRGEIDTDSMIDFLNLASANSRKFHFNLNIDIHRLLLCKYPKKLVFSGDKDSFALSQPESLIINGIKISGGVMERSKKYEEVRIEESLTRLEEKMGKKFILGMYGQLSFVDDNSRTSVEKLFANIINELDESSLTICHSGSLIGASSIAYKEALKKDIPTIAIIPQSIEHLVPTDKFTHLIIEGDDWGESAFIFGGLPNRLIFAGGGYWSYLELIKALERNKPVSFLDFQGSRYCSEMISAQER